MGTTAEAKAQLDALIAGNPEPDSPRAKLERHIGQAWKRDPEDVKRAVEAAASSGCIRVGRVGCVALVLH